MKKVRTFSVVIALLIAFSALVFPSAPKAEAITRPDYKSDVPTVAQKADFTYRVQTNRIFISGYTGTDTKIIIPETIDGLPVFSILPKAFADSDITYVRLPSTLEIIASNAFNECDSLTQIDVESNNTKFCSIDGVVYTKDKKTLKVFPAGRTGDFMIPKGVTNIANFAFYRCYQLENVDMYNTVTSIGERAFSFCWGLKSIRFSDNLETVGTMAFSHCNNLTKIYLPKSITSIGSNAFLGKVTSDNNSKEYYFVDGIYCVKGSYPAKYIRSLGLSYINTSPTLTNIEKGVTLTDVNNVIETGAELKVDIQPLSTVSYDFDNTNYTDGFVVDIYVYKDGKISVPKGSFEINIDNISTELIPTATKVFYTKNSRNEELKHTGSTKTATYEANSLGTFVVLLCNDFSLKGDPNGDGKITLADARIALLASANILELTPEQKSACDFVTTGADKGVITTADARRILRTAAGLY